LSVKCIRLNAAIAVCKAGPVGVTPPHDNFGKMVWISFKWGDQFNNSSAPPYDPGKRFRQNVLSPIRAVKLSDKSSNASFTVSSLASILGLVSTKIASFNAQVSP